MIKFSSVSKVFPNGYVGLQDVDFSIEPGEFVYILGESGAGKTTLMRMLIREVLPTEGEIFINGEEITSLPKSKVPQLRRRVGVVFQDYKLILERTVEENIALALEIMGHKSQEVKKQVMDVLDLVGLEGREKMFPTQLSGGELQRVAIARALVMAPQVLFADEPTGNLDQKTGHGIVELLQKIRDLGTTVLVATHDHSLLKKFPGRQIQVEQGKLVKDTAAPAPTKKKKEEKEKDKDKVTEEGEEA